MREHTKHQLLPLLRVLRGYSMLDEVREAEFYLNGQDFIHFHETPDGVIADVLLSRGRVSLPVSSESGQAELLDRIESRLASLEEHGRHRHSRDRKGRQRDT